MQLLASEVSADNYTRPPEIVILLMLTNTIGIALHMHTQGRFNNHTTKSLYRIMVTAMSVMGEMKLVNTVPRAGLEPTSLAFRPFHHIGSLMLPLFPCPPVYVAPCLRSQCRLVQY